MMTDAGWTLRMAAVVLMLGAAPAGAQQALVFDPAPLAACVDEGGASDCIGIAANACIMATQGGNSTAGMIDCFAAESAWWDAAMAQAYAALVDSERSGDEWAQSSPGTAGRPSGVAAIEAVQRHWLDWREAACAYEALQFWRGSAERLVATTCRVHLTAEQALRLRAWLAGSG